MTSSRSALRGHYLTGATSNFFSTSLVAVTPLLLIEQQARLSAPQLLQA